MWPDGCPARAHGVLCASLAVTGAFCAHSPAGGVPRARTAHRAVSVTPRPERCSLALRTPSGCCRPCFVSSLGPCGDVLGPWRRLPELSHHQARWLPARVWVLAGLSHLPCGASGSGRLDLFFHRGPLENGAQSPASRPACEVSLVSRAGGPPGSEVLPEGGWCHIGPKVHSGSVRGLAFSLASRRSPPVSLGVTLSWEVGVRVGVKTSMAASPTLHPFHLSGEKEHLHVTQRPC